MEEIIVEEEIFRLNKSQSMAGGGYSNSTSTDSFANRMYGTALLIDKYYTPLLCLFGALGNCLSLAVFCLDAKYRSQSSSYYLSALALSDTGFLLSVFVVWLEGVHGGVITLDITCPLVMYLGQVTCFMSVYFTVAFSIERYVAVHYPFSRPRICTRSKAKKAIGVITVIALVLFSYAWVIAKVITIPMNGLGNKVVDQKVQEGHQEQLEQPADTFIVTQLPEFEDHSIIRTFDILYDDKTEQNHVWKLRHHKRSSKAANNSLPDGSQRVIDYATNHNKLLRPKSEFDKNKNLLRNIPQSKLLTNPNSPEGAQHDIHIDEDDDGDDDDDDDDRGGNGYSDMTEGGKGVRCICSVPEVYYKVSEIANYIDSILTLIFPFFLIGFFNVRIAVTVWKLKDQRRNIVATTTANSTNGSSVATTQNNHFCNRQGTLRCSMRETTSTTLAPYRNSCNNHNSRKNYFCYSLKTNKAKNSPSVESGGGGRHKNYGLPSTVRFQDCIEMSQMESNTQCSQTVSVSLNNIQSTSVLTTSVTTANSRFCILRRKKSHSSSEVRVTKTLLLVSLLFVLLNFPAHTIRCAQFLQTITGTKQGQDILFALQPWANILFNTNFAVNFLLYCVSGKNFRNSLRNIALRNCQCPSHRSKMTTKFSWTSDKRNKRKRTNSCVTGTASSLLPSTATLATTTEAERSMKTRQTLVPRYSKATGTLLKCQDDLANGFCESVNPQDEDDESTAVYFTYYSHDSHLNYLDEVRDDMDDENIDEIVSV